MRAGEDIGYMACKPSGVADTVQHTTADAHMDYAGIDVDTAAGNSHDSIPVAVDDFVVSVPGASWALVHCYYTGQASCWQSDSNHGHTGSVKGTLRVCTKK